MVIQLKRAYEPPAPDDGCRILVDRLWPRAVSKDAARPALQSCAHGAGRRLSRFDAMKYWKTVLKEKQRKMYREQFSELLNRSGDFPPGYIQEFDFAYKDATDILRYQPYLKKVTHTKPVATVKFTEI